MVQQALRLGLAERDRRIRSDLVRTLIDSIALEQEAEEVSEADLRAFYDEHRDFFTPPASMRVRQVFFRAAPGADAPAARADEALRRLRAGEDFESVRNDSGDPELPPLPDAFLPPQKLREYLGPTALRTALELNGEEYSDLVRSGSGLHILQVTGRQGGEPAPFEQMREQVEAEWRRRRGEEALREYLKRLRESSRIAIGE